MKKTSLLSLAALCLFFLSVPGCSDSGSSVVEAPPAEEMAEEEAMEGMSDEDYDAAMDAEGEE